LQACGGGGDAPASPIVVNSLDDSATPGAGQVTLRSALAAAASGQAIRFDAALNGATVALTQVADRAHAAQG